MCLLYLVCTKALAKLPSSCTSSVFHTRLFVVGVRRCTIGPGGNNINAYSIRNETDIILKILQNEIDILKITEFWLTNNETDIAISRSITPSGYKFIHLPRPNGRGRGGGIALVYRDTLKMEEQQIETFSTFEHMELLLTAGNSSIRIVPVYRPPKTLHSLFLEQFEILMDSVMTKPGKLLCIGDFNIHFENERCRASRNFRAMLNGLGLDQRVTEPTHEKNHTLDLVITRQDEYDLVTNLSVMPIDCFDHSTILFTLPWKKMPFEKKTIIYRKIKSIDISAFKNDILNSDLLQNPPSDLDALVDSYFCTLRT